MECNVSDLVKRGHDQAAELKASCGAVDVRDVAQLISDLATQLDVQLARSNSLAAENAGLKSAIEKHADSYIMCGYCRTERDGKNDDVCEVLDSTPATEAFLAEVRAQAVEMFAKEMHADISGDDAREFADQLRKGVQS
ncbi:hypothetical protein R7W82_001861 [Enterobacter hormaechei]|nr:hypothetical protein [Enterobacter hormaechei]ELT0864269.1 hypothetical protein [Enterobacter hormaechei]EMD5675328.1 hypothetical protein [Enterobacter hormaechei]EMD6793537.1 hypothetical protein [Enterobacter hormaechei subsp. steigerwaltii]EMF2144060.1 hypothetical protein [Enterobacter hormaechei]